MVAGRWPATVRRPAEGGTACLLLAEHLQKCAGQLAREHECPAVAAAVAGEQDLTAGEQGAAGLLHALAAMLAADEEEHPARNPVPRGGRIAAWGAAEISRAPETGGCRAGIRRASHARGLAHLGRG